MSLPSSLDVSWVLAEALVLLSITTYGPLPEQGSQHP